RTPLAALLAVLIGMLVLAGAPAASADDPDGPPDPVRLVIATAGLTWEDIDPGTTPHLQCLADRSGAGAMNTTSTSVVSTKRQGLETLHSGYRGLAEEAPRTSGIPTPATDQWEQLEVPVSTVELGGPDSASGAADVAAALEDAGIVEVIAPSVSRGDDPARSQQLASLDAAVGAVLDELGAARPRTSPARCWSPSRPPIPSIRRPSSSRARSPRARRACRSRSTRPSPTRPSPAAPRSRPGWWCSPTCCPQSSTRTMRAPTG